MVWNSGTIRNLGFKIPIIWSILWIPDLDLNFLINHLIFELKCELIANWLWWFSASKNAYRCCNRSRVQFLSYQSRSIGNDVKCGWFEAHLISHFKFGDVISHFKFDVVVLALVRGHLVVWTNHIFVVQVNDFWFWNRTQQSWSE